MLVEECPYCKGPMECDTVDVDVGFVQCGPYLCQICGANEIHPDDDRTNLTEEEKRTGFYRSGKVSPKTNVDDNGNIISHKVADYLYRKEYFEKYGNPYNAPLSRY